MPIWPEAPAEAAPVEGEPVIGSFGFLNANKRIPQLLEAFARRSHASPTRASPARRRRGARARASSSGSSASGWRDAVVRHGYVDEARFWALVGRV